MEKLLSVSEVLARLGVSRATLSRWRASGRFCKARKVPGSGRVFFDAKDVATWERLLPRVK